MLTSEHFAILCRGLHGSVKIVFIFVTEFQAIDTFGGT